MRLLSKLLGSIERGEWARFDESAADMSAVSAAFLEALQMSHGDLATLLRSALQAEHRGDRTYVWTRDVYDDSVVYEVSTDDATVLYQRSYTVADGAVTLGDAFPVIAVTQYVRAEQSSVTVPAMPITQVSAPAQESAELTGELVPLVEKAVKADGQIKIKVIQAGQGSSGWYPEDVLKRDGPKAFVSGLHMHLDHPSVSEESDRPERSVTTLAGTLTSDARWEEQGPAGPGLYADAKVRSDLAPLIEELAPHIGVSIRALGKAGTRDIDGKKVRTIEAIDQARSVDFVTVAGAGGKVLDLVESARSRRAQPTEGNNDVKELEEAQGRIKTLEETIAEQGKVIARLHEANVLREAHGIVIEALAATSLPKLTRDRLAGALTANATIKDGALDREALMAAIEAAVKDAAAELAEATGGNPVRGMGATVPKDEDVRAGLIESFVAAGYSKEIAERMAAL